MGEEVPAAYRCGHIKILDALSYYGGGLKSLLKRSEWLLKTKVKLVVKAAIGCICDLGMWTMQLPAACSERMAMAEGMIR